MRDNILIVGWTDKIENELKKKLTRHFPEIEILKFGMANKEELKKIYKNLSKRDIKCKYISIGLYENNFLFEGKLEDIEFLDYKLNLKY